MATGSDFVHIDIDEVFEQTLVNQEYDEAKKLLPKINITAKDSQGNNYVMRACLNNDLERLKWLLQNVDDIQVYDKPGKNLLFLAIEAGSLDIVKWLLSEKPQYLRDLYKGQTPLHAAVLRNNIDIVKVIVTTEPKFEIQNKDCKTILDLAHDNQFTDVFKWLLIFKSFEILNHNMHEEGKVNQLESLFTNYGYEFLDAKSEENNMTIAEYVALTEQVEILRWLKSKNIKVDDSLLAADADETRITYNMLLLGETGVGKSTFINAFVNYLNFNTLEEAENSTKIHSVIPTNFTITDDNFQPKTVYFGKDINESYEPGLSATQSPRTYLFKIGNVDIRIIDTPGIGDTRGIKKDEENFAKLLTLISEFKDIHGICIMLKPNNARLNVLFEYCVKQLFSNLQKDASQNIMFLFTNSRSTFYRPGDTAVPLKAILDQIKSDPPHISIPFSKKNIFCLDNEAFRFLIAKKENIEFDEDEQENYSKSWDKSATVCIELLKYLKSLSPHKIQETVSLNEARRLILRLSMPLAEITQNIQDNINRVDRLNANLGDKSKDIEELKKYLLVPRIGLEITHLEEPMTVCAHTNCTESIKIEDSSSIHYKQICHNPCYLKGVPIEVRGDPELINCNTMNKRNDTATCWHASCLHNFRDHMHIRYKTETTEVMEEDPNIAMKIERNLIDKSDIQNKIDELTVKREQFTREIETIQRSMAQFAYFLKHNAISPFNDTYKKYIDYLIEREEKLGEFGKKDRIQNFKKLITTYESYKNVLDQELQKVQENQSDSKVTVNAEEVIKLIDELDKLPHSGKMIKDALAAQNEAAKAEVYINKETTIRPVKVKGESHKSWIRRIQRLLFISKEK